MTYALENNLRFGRVKNREGIFIQPNLESVTAAAAASLGVIPEDLRYAEVAAERCVTATCRCAHASRVGQWLGLKEPCIAERR